MGMVRVGMGLSLPVWLGLWGLGIAVEPGLAQTLPRPTVLGEAAIGEVSEAPALVGLPTVGVKPGAIGPVPLGAAIVAPQIVAPQIVAPQILQPQLGQLLIGQPTIGQPTIGQAIVPALAQTPQVTVPDLPPLYGLPGSMPPQPAPIAQPAIIPQPAPIAQPVPIEAAPMMEVNPTPAVTVLDFGQPLPVQSPGAALVQPVLAQPIVQAVPVQAAPVQAAPVQPALVQPALVQQAETVQAPIVVPTSGGLLPKGTMLPLRYMGSQALQLKAGDPQPEVLVLNAPIVDPSGRVILPLGTQVVGRFETDRQGSRFVVQAVAQGNQSQLVLAASGPIGQKQTSKLALGSGIGAAAGLILGGKVGLLGGAAVGAATSYFTPPKSVTIAPNQVVMVRLEEDWR